MRKVSSLIALALPVAAAAQSATRIYGFADASFVYNSVNHGFMRQFVGQDTVQLSLDHANLYFDFHPAERVKALIEVGFASRPTYETWTGGSNPAIVSADGVALTDDQVLAAVTEAKLSELTASLASAGASQATIDSVKSANRSTVASAVSSSLSPVLAALRASDSATSSTDRQSLSLERAQIDLELVPAFNLRFGKFITPAGVWNVDHASPVILTVRQPLQTTVTPIFPESQIGVMGFGGAPLGDHDLSWSGYISGGRIDGESSLLDPLGGSNLDKFTDLAYGGHLGVHLDLLKGIDLGTSFFNGSVRRKYLTGQTTVEVSDLVQGLGTDYTFVDDWVTREREWAVGGDARVHLSSLLLQGEANYRARDNEMADGSSDIFGWYALATWQQPVTDWLAVAPYGMFERVTTSLDGEASGVLNQDGIAGFHSIIFGVNANLFTNLRFKTEYMMLRLEKDPDTWSLTDVSAEDLTIGMWSSQVSVAF